MLVGPSFIEDSYSPKFVVNLYYVDGDSFAVGPEVARLQISRGGETLGDATFEPDYSAGASSPR